MLAYNIIVPTQIRGHLLKRPEPYEDALKKITVLLGRKFAFWM